MAKRSPKSVDKYVGKRLKDLRILRGLSQEKLGDTVNISFQQIQKYEKGSNRISCSRLYQFSEILDVPVTDFFPSNDTPKASLVAEVPTEALKLAKLYMELPKEMQSRALSVMRALLEE